MIEQQLTLSDLPVSSSEIYEMMGYGNQTVPEPEIEAETQKLLKQISAIARPSFLFFSINGQLDTMKETLTVEHITFHLGKIITRQLRKSETYQPVQSRLLRMARFRAASSFLLISIPSSLWYPPLGFQPDDSYQIGKRNHRNWFRRT